MINDDTLSLDFAELENSIEQYLLKHSTQFKAIYPGETSKILVEILSSYYAMGNYKLVAAVMNSFMSTAFSETSIYALADMLGASLKGKKGSSINVTLRRTNNIDHYVVIPALSSFSINGMNFYNKDPYYFAANSDLVNMTLYQGEVQYEKFITSGNPNERFIFGSNFSVDPSFIKVKVNNTDWSVNDDSLLDYANDILSDISESRVVLFKTRPDGVSFIQLGNGFYGQLPSKGSVIYLTYAISKGRDSNFTTVNAEVKLSSVIDSGDGTPLQIETVSTTSASGGTNQTSIDLLKYVAPKMYGSNNRCVLEKDYTSLLMYEQGYQDVKVWGEYKEAESKGYADNSMMNRVFYSGIINLTDLQYSIIGTGDGSETHFTGSINTNLAIPGSITITHNTSETFNDNGGVGFLFSNQSTINNINEINSISADSEDSNHGITNVKSNDYSKFYQSDRAPQLMNPIKIVMKSNAGLSLAGFRMLPINDFESETRAFPKTVMMLAHESSDPDTTVSITEILQDPEWIKLTPYTDLDEAPVGVWSNWIGLNNVNTEYKTYLLCIFDRYGNNDYTKINKISLIKTDAASTVDYTNGNIDVTFEETPESGASITVMYRGDSINENQLKKDSNLINKYNHFTTYMKFVQPVSRSINIVGKVIYETDSLEELVNTVETAIKNLYSIQPGMIGSGFRLSKLYQTIMNINGVKRCFIDNPSTDIEIGLNEFLTVNKLSLTYQPINKADLYK